MKFEIKNLTIVSSGRDFAVQELDCMGNPLHSVEGLSLGQAIEVRDFARKVVTSYLISHHIKIREFLDDYVV